MLTLISRAIGSFTAGDTTAPADGEELHIIRKIWFERSNLNIARLETYKPDGSIDSDVHYADWQPTGDTQYPHQISISRPGDDYKLDITIKKLAVNESIAPDRFILQQPPGTELVRVGEESGEEQPPQPKPEEQKP